MSAIDTAIKHGANFVQRPQGDWLAIHRKRGRSLPLVQLLADTKEEAAEMYLNYFHVKERGHGHVSST